MAVLHVSDRDFKQEVLGSAQAVLVDFWAPWCGPCRMVAPIVDDLAEEFKSQLKVCKVDVDESPQTAAQFGIMSIPTLMFFKNGKVVEQVVGALNKQDLKKKIQGHL